MAIMELSRPPEVIFDPVRGANVAASPEERVRQYWLHALIQEKGFPKHLILIEKELSQLPHLSARRRSLPDRRIDILCMAPSADPQNPFFPLLLIECKEGKVSPQAYLQLAGYNDHVKACFIGIANPEEFRLGYYDASSGKYRFVTQLPTFKEFTAYIRNGFPLSF